MTSHLAKQLMEHEGIRLKPYRDTVGKLTIGVGRNLDDVGISMAEAMLLLQNDIQTVRLILSGFEWYPKLDKVRQDVVTDMCFNLGPSGFALFTKMLDALKAGDYDTAAAEMLRSKWAGQVKGRAVRLAKMMRTGERQG